MSQLMKDYDRYYVYDSDYDSEMDLDRDVWVPMDYKDIILSLNIIESELNDGLQLPEGGTSDSLTSIDLYK